MGERFGSSNFKRNHERNRKFASLLPQRVVAAWEAHSRDKAERKGATILNDLLYYDIQPGYPDEIQLHVSPTFTKSPFQVKRLAIEGMHELARRLQENPADFAYIKNIAGYSWIVYDNPELAEQFGFNVTGVDPDDKTSLVTMSVGDFLKRYGK